ncbi:class I SAM-dependent methyltransferase [Variovorax sp. 38R]|nr:class I SAM-dependent methyltransferase [Variovorax sp. 38R]
MQPLFDAIASMSAPVDAQRIFHGRGGLHPECAHLSLDFFPPVWVLTSFKPATDGELAAIGAALERRWSQLAPGETLQWVFQCRHEGRSSTQLMGGSVPDPHWVTEEGARYRVNVGRGQNHGLFLDMAEGRRWVRAFVKARPDARSRVKVLNLFAYTCAFSVVALQA